MGLGVVDFLLAALDVPFSPGGDDGHVGRKGLDAQLKADLVVALAGAAVADGVAAFLLGDLHQVLGDGRAGEAGAQQIGALVLGPGLQGGEDVVVDELVGQVQHIQLGSAGLDGLFLQAVQLGALAHVSGGGDDLAAVVFLQPGNDDGGVQTAGVGQQNLVVLSFHENDFLSDSPQRGRLFLILFDFACMKFKAPWTGTNKDARFWGVQKIRQAGFAPAPGRRP